jgi:hypothetical protein
MNSMSYVVVLNPLEWSNSTQWGFPRRPTSDTRDPFNLMERMQEIDNVGSQTWRISHLKKRCCAKLSVS